MHRDTNVRHDGIGITEVVADLHSTPISSSKSLKPGMEIGTQQWPQPTKIRLFVRSRTSEGFKLEGCKQPAPIAQV